MRASNVSTAFLAVAVLSTAGLSAAQTSSRESVTSIEISVSGSFSEYGPELPRARKVDRWLAGAGLTPAGEGGYGWALVVLALNLREKDPNGAGCIWRSARLLDPQVGGVDPAALSIDEDERRFLADELEADRYPLGEQPPIEPDYDAPLPPLDDEPDEYEPPRRGAATYPRYTAAARKAQTRGPLRLTGIVGTDGRYRDLRVVEPRPNGLVHTAIAAACTWRFLPAMRNGEEPIAVPWEAGFEMKPP